MAQVLVVDSEVQIREVLQTVLERVGHKATLAENSAEARRLYSDRPFDVVVIDIIPQDADSINALMESMH